MQITLNNNKTITLNSQQEDALIQIREWLQKDSREDLFFTLSGFAGTGKTTITKEALKGYYKSTCISAPTHKAVKVISRMTGRQGVTAHSLLGLRPNTDLDNFDINRPQFDPLNEPLMAEYRLVVFDEASMLNKDIAELFFREAIKYNTKILFMGDAGQLPPVKEYMSIIFSDERIKHKTELTKVERQSDSNPLMFTYDAIRLDFKSKKDLFEHKTEMNGKGEGRLFTNNQKEFLNIAEEQYKIAIETCNSDQYKIVAFTNESVSAINLAIRNRLIKEETFIATGDLLFGYNTLVESFETILTNSQDYRVIRTLYGENLDGLKGFITTLQNVDTLDVHDVFILDHKDSKNLLSFKTTFKELLSNAINHKGSFWASYYRFKNKILLMQNLYEDGKLLVKKDIDYGYAITVHKSQGSTYTNIGIVESDIDTCIDYKAPYELRHVMKNKLKYVAFSRPTHKAIVYTNKPIT